MNQPVGRVLGTLDAMPLDFWLGVAEGQYVHSRPPGELTSQPLGDVVQDGNAC